MPGVRSALVLAALLPAALAAQDRRAAFDSAAIAWDEGRFVAALAGFERLLAGGDAGVWRDTIALLTGERYVTTPVAPHGHRVLWSPDGRWATIEHGARWVGAGDRARLLPFGADSVPRFTLLSLDGDTLVPARTAIEVRDEWERGE